MKKLIMTTLVLAAASLLSSAQPWTFSRIPGPLVKQVATGVHWDGSTGFTAGYSGVVRWTGGEQKYWPFTSLRDIEACGTIDVSGNYAGLLRSRTFVRVINDVLEEREVFVFSAGGTSLGRGYGDDLLLSRPHALQRELYVYHVEGMEIGSTDTLHVDSVAKTQLYRRPSDGLVLLSARHVVDADTLITTWALNEQSGQWETHDELLWGEVAFLANGDRAVVPDSLERAATIANNTIIGLRNLDRGRRWAVYRSVNGGSSYEPMPGLDTISARIVGHGTWQDSMLLCATADSMFLWVDATGAMSTMDAPWVETTYFVREMESAPTPVDHVLCTIEIARPPLVYDVNTLSWKEIGALIPEASSWDIGFAAPPYYVGQDPLGRFWRGDLRDGSATQIASDSTSSFPIGTGFTRNDGRLWMIGSLLFYEVDEDGGMTLHRMADPTTALYDQVEVNGSSLLFCTRSDYVLDSTGNIVSRTPLYGILRTTDTGATWTMSNSGLGINTSIWDLVRATDGVLYAGAAHNLAGSATRGEIYRSTDEGATWTSEPGFLPSTIKREFQIRTGPDNAMLVIGVGLVYRRTPTSAWVEVGGPWGDAIVFDAVILPGSRRLLASTARGLFLSDVAVSVSEGSDHNVVGCQPVVRGRRLLLPVYQPDAGPIGIQVSDLAGRLVYQGSVQNPSDGIDLPRHLAPGAYLVGFGPCQGLVWLE